MSDAKGKTIGTHSGTFHCDEALACYMLKLLPEYKNAKIVRSRDKAVLATCDIVVDVGAEFDPKSHRYDHHQREFAEFFDDEHKTTKLSSAGLIYKYFGRSIVKQLIQSTEEDVELIYQHVYDGFVEGIDAVDNGVSQYPKDCKPNYNLNTGLSARVSRLNPAWNQKNVDIDAQFAKAMAMTGEEFEDAVMRKFNIWLPARAIVESSIKDRKNVHASGEVIALKTSTVWKSHLYDLEEELRIPQLKYVLYSDDAGNWRIQCVPERAGSFISRKPLPEAWRGVRDEALSKLSGIDGCIFVHASGFIGGNKTYEGALRMANDALSPNGAEPALKKLKADGN